jgi:hypothetical protein
LGETPDPYFYDQDEPDFDQNGPNSRKIEPKFTPSQLIARAFISDTTGYNTFSRLSYYEMRLERSFFQAHNKLERLRAKRTSTPATP